MTVKLIEIYRDIIGMLDEKASRLVSVWAKERHLGWQPTIEQTEKQKMM